MIPHNKPTLEKEEEQAAIEVIQSGWVAQGSEVENFENELCTFLGLPEQHTVALSSGTAALFMALWVLQAENKSVAIPVYACSALRNAVGLARANEILVDIAPDNPNICLDSLRKCKATIAIVPHIFGLPVNLSNVNNTEIIEDCAQAIGSSIKGIPVGLQGKIGIFSFYATKLITTGYGGVLVSKDKSLVDAVRDYRNFDCRKDKKHRFNFQMTDLQAAIGRVQLGKLPMFLDRRAKIFAKYQQADLKLLDNKNKAYHIARYRAVMRTNNPIKVMNHLEKNGIKAIVPVEDWELLGEPSLFPNAFRLTQETVSLPIYPTLSDIDINKIIKATQEML